MSTRLGFEFNVLIRLIQTLAKKSTKFSILEIVFFLIQFIDNFAVCYSKLST